MKKTFLLTMGATALIAVFAIVAFAWQAKTSTSWQNGKWNDNYSGSVTSTTSTGYVFAEAGDYFGGSCSWRLAEAVLTSDHGQTFGTTYCPTGVPTPYCCINTQWNPTIGTSYQAHASQEWRGIGQGCGPTKATIQNSSIYPCAPDSPGGP